MLQRAVAPAQRQREIARFELSLEATRDERISEQLTAARDLMFRQAEEIARTAGCKDPTRAGATLAFFLNSVLLDYVVATHRVIPAGEFVDYIERILSAY